MLVVQVQEVGRIILYLNDKVVDDLLFDGHLKVHLLLIQDDRPVCIVDRDCGDDGRLCAQARVDIARRQVGGVHIDAIQAGKVAHMRRR